MRTHRLLLLTLSLWLVVQPLGGVAALAAPLPQQTQIPDSEYQALVAFYNSTDGDNWTNNEDYWLQSDTPCSWYGVVCAGGHVTEIGLSMNGLSGPIPTVLAQLTELRVLGLRGNALTGEIPTVLAELSHLRELNLGNCQLSGGIPAELGDLSELEMLWLEGNDLTGPIPPELGKLTKLKGLALYENGLTGPLPPELGELVDLVSLHISDNPLRGALPPSLTNLSPSFFLFGGTDLCEPGDGIFQAWLDGISTLSRTDLICDMTRLPSVVR